jgi:hypothetical protein
LKLVACHIAGSRNVGDAVCSPANYFDFGSPVEVVRLRDAIPPCDAVIFGGGAIGNNIGKRAAAAAARVRIAWGLGETRHDGTLAGPAPSGFDLFGSRDDGQAGADWVPCASCMSDLFDVRRDVRHEVVLYFNRRRPRPSIAGIPTMDNEAGFEGAVGFLASGAVVVTNSYHGAYWATLLGRAVVIVDVYSSKLRQFRHRPAYADSENWQSALDDVPRYPGALAETRSANVFFHGRVMQRLAA